MTKTRIGLLLGLLAGSFALAQRTAFYGANLAAHVVGHRVILSWTQSTTSGITSNNVYRSTVNGGPYTSIYQSNAPIIAFTDSLVTSGVTYYYVVTAVDGNGESGYSNQVTAAVP